VVDSILKPEERADMENVKQFIRVYFPDVKMDEVDMDAFESMGLNYPCGEACCQLVRQAAAYRDSLERIIGVGRSDDTVGVSVVLGCRIILDG